MAKGTGRGGSRGRKKVEEAKPPIELQGNLAAREQEVRDCRAGYNEAILRRNEANADAKVYIDRAEAMGVDRKAFKDACKTTTNMDPDKRRRYDESLAFCRHAFGFDIETGQGLFFDGGDAKAEHAGGEGDEMPDGEGEAGPDTNGLTDDEADKRVDEVRTRVRDAGRQPLN